MSIYVVQPTESQKAIEDTFRSKAMKDSAIEEKRTRTNGHPRPDGKLIRKLMNQAKMKPRDLSEKIGVTKDKIQLIFRDVGTEIEIIQKIAEVFEIEVKHIIRKK